MKIFFIAAKILLLLNLIACNSGSGDSSTGSVQANDFSTEELYTENGISGDTLNVSTGESVSFAGIEVVDTGNTSKSSVIRLYSSDVSYCIRLTYTNSSSWSYTMDRHNHGVDTCSTVGTAFSSGNQSSSPVESLKNFLNNGQFHTDSTGNVNGLIKINLRVML